MNTKRLLLVAALSAGAGFAQAQNARVQVIHNSADAAAQTVDIYLNGTMLLDNFQFRTASPFIDAPAGVPLSVAVAPGNSMSVNDAIATFPITLTAGQTYVVVANGIVSTSGYSPATPFGLNVYNMGREAASMSGNTDVLVMHGSTDAPTVDVVAAGAGTVVNDASYGDFSGYLQLPTNDYTLSITDASGATTVASFAAPLATLNLQGAALTVLASGFLTPANNSNGPAFGLWAATAAGGPLVQLPAATVSAPAAAALPELAVWPNPAADRLYLSLEKFAGRSLSIEVLTLTGQLVERVSYATMQPAAGTHMLDLSRLAPGTYLVAVRTAEQTITRKISRL